MNPSVPPLTDAQRHAIDDLCSRALAMEPAGRAAFVSEHAGDDARVAQEVLAILAALFDDAFLETPASLPPTGHADRLDPEHRIGQSVGPYRITQVLGEGGFAIVYLAEQQYPMKRLVALKVLKPGMDSRAVVARFEGERQTLAIMDHPGVASVFDGGVTDDGLPYFVMELVRGKPITRWCDEHRLNVDRRLGLFLEVCEAVQHAHQKGVIHRDLKPSNVLIHERDTNAFAKVIDFGIAKAIDEPPAPAAPRTLVGQFIGTPEYMPPEQMSGHPGDIDTRTDVYALGVILYELLCAARPIEAHTLSRAGVRDLARALRQQQITRPSARAARMGADAARARNADPESLDRRIRGDLDWIAMTCLALDREQRYASVGALAADIRRHLRDEPIEARPPSRAYRLRKFIRRNRVGVAVGGVVSVLMIAGAITIIALGASALKQANRSAKLNAQFLPALADIDPESLTPRIESVEDMIDAYARGIDREFADYPQDRADLHTGVGLAYLNRDAERAVRHFETALDIRSALRADDAIMGETLHNLARAYWKSGEFAKAEQEYLESLRLFQAAKPHDESRIARAKQHLGATCRAMDRFDEAEQWYAESLEIWRRVRGEQDQDYAQTLYSLALLHQRTERYELAERECREILAIIEPISEPDALPLRRVRATLDQCAQGVQPPEN